MQPPNSTTPPGPPMAHMVYFKLSDTDNELINRFTAACKDFLGGHPGQTHFSIGYRVLDINRDVSATGFEVAVHMIFHDFNAYKDYLEDEKHNKFITETAGMSTTRIVYDSFISYETGGHIS